jgi:hypothetical protein
MSNSYWFTLEQLHIPTILQQCDKSVTDFIMSEFIQFSDYMIEPGRMSQELETDFGK